MSYDYAANGWQRLLGIWVKVFDKCIVVTPDDPYLCVVKGKCPEWASDAIHDENPADLDAAWAAELKRRESLPLLDPSLWQGGDDRGYWYHPEEGGYRVSLGSDGYWPLYRCPNVYLGMWKDPATSKADCENHARTRKGLPPL